MKAYNLIFILIMLWSATATSASDIYQYKDKHGNLVISNHPSGKAIKMKLPPLVSYAAPISQSDLTIDTHKPTHDYLSDISIIKVRSPQIYANQDKATVYTREGRSFAYNTPKEQQGRSQILHEELAHEKKALAESLTLINQLKALKSLNKVNNSDKFDVKIATLQDNITAHQENIETLTKILNDQKS